MSGTTDAAVYREGLAPIQRQAFDLLMERHFDPSRAQRLCVNPGQYVLFPQFAEMVDIVKAAGLWDDLYHYWDRVPALA